MRADVISFLLMVAVVSAVLYSEEYMSVDVVVGLQRGDEGKGRFVDMLAEDHDIVARFNGADNAGHTVVLPTGVELNLHTIPSGIAHEHTMNVLGNGVLVSPSSVLDEIASIERAGFEVNERNLKISSAAALILPHHIYEDVIREGGVKAQGSTKKGVGPAASEKAARDGVRAEIINNYPDELFEKVRDNLRAQAKQRNKAGIEKIDEVKIAEEYVEQALKLGEFVTDTVFFLNQELKKIPEPRILAEGAQAFLLDPEHGMHPYTTSTPTVSAGAAYGLGIPPQAITKVVGIAKAVQSHVGGGPFVTRITDVDLLDRLDPDPDSVDAEYGKTTGRKRDLGYLDIAGLRRANMVNGTNEVALTKLDRVPRFGREVLLCVAYARKGKVLYTAVDSARKMNQSLPAYVSLPTWTEDIKNVREFKDLPLNAQNYVHFVEDQMGVPITMLGVGPQRDQVIVRN